MTNPVTLPCDLFTGHILTVRSVRGEVYITQQTHHPQNRSHLQPTDNLLAHNHVLYHNPTFVEAERPPFRPLSSVATAKATMSVCLSLSPPPPPLPPVTAHSASSLKFIPTTLRVHYPSTSHPRCSLAVLQPSVPRSRGRRLVSQHQASYSRLRTRNLQAYM
jgi:hypothetical protein